MTRAVLALALTAAAAGATGMGPAPARASDSIEVLVELARTDPASVGARIRVLERHTERDAARLGLAPGARRPLPVAPEELAYRARGLGNVAGFLDARHEVLRPRVGRPAAPRRGGGSTRADAVRDSARLGLDRPAPGRRGGGADRQRWRDITRWLSFRREVLRDVEQPLILPAIGDLTSPFGPRGGRLHAGADIAGPSGTPIRAAASGVVAFAGWNAGYGRLVVVRHPGGLSTAYGHLSAIGVGPGRPVAQGAVIGRMGTTGHSTGVHLHFETRLRGRAVNPLPYLPPLRVAPGA